jgi:signal transduction histidine kinase
MGRQLRRRLLLAALPAAIMAGAVLVLPSPADPLAIASTAVAVLAAFSPACRWPPQPSTLMAAGAAAAAVSIAETAAYRGPGNDTAAAWLVAETVPMIVVVTLAVRRLAAHSAGLLGLLLVASIAVSPLRIGLRLQPPAPAVQVIGVCSAWALLGLGAAGVGVYLRSLDRGRERSVAAARRSQRMQLAQDLHDWVAHEITGLVLEAQAAQLPVPGTRQTARALKAIEEAGVRALDAVDHAIALMREEGPPGPAAMAPRIQVLDELRQTTARFSAAGPARVELDIGPGLTELRPDLAATVHRVVVESLTNVRRHAGSATLVRISVRRETSGLKVKVTNDASGHRGPHLFTANRRAGAGLSALAERVEALGGTLRAGPAEPAGWSVCAVLPETS